MILSPFLRTPPSGAGIKDVQCFLQEAGTEQLAVVMVALSKATSCIRM